MYSDYFGRTFSAAYICVSMCDHVRAWSPSSWHARCASQLLHFGITFNTTHAYVRTWSCPCLKHLINACMMFHCYDYFILVEHSAQYISVYRRVIMSVLEALHHRMHDVSLLRLLHFGRTFSTVYFCVLTCDHVRAWSPSSWHALCLIVTITSFLYVF
jgi:hypothetical protein